MPRTIWAGAVAVGVFVVTGTGCRLCNRHDEPCQSAAARPAQPNCPPSVYPTGYKKGVAPSSSVPFAGAAMSSEPFMLPGEVQTFPTSFGGPVYPVGEPVPLRSASPAPANELPYPTIPTPNVPEGPTGLAIPPVEPRTTADPRSK